MRVGIDARLAFWDQRTGTGRYARSLIQAIAKVDTQNQYVLIDTKSRHASGEAAPELAPNLVTRRLNWDDRLLRVAWLATRRPKIELAVGPIDMLHCPNIDYMPTLCKARVVTVHDLCVVTNGQFFPRKDRWLHLAALHRSVRDASLIIAVSNHTATGIRKHLNVEPKRIRVIPEAPAHVFSSRPAVADSEIGRQFSLEGPYFLFVGTLEPRKNISRLLTAFVEARRKAHIPQALVIVGREGWLARPIAQELRAAQATEDIRVLGYLPDVALASVMRSADALVYPAIEEGFGLPVVEAMACGTPVITSRSSAMAELVGNAGMLVNPFDVAEIRNALIGLSQDGRMRDEMRALGYERVGQYSWERVAIETIAVYGELAA